MNVYERAGTEAFKRGAMRVVPRAVLVEHGIQAAEAWYRGWDRANLAAPVEGVTP